MKATAISRRNNVRRRINEILPRGLKLIASQTTHEHRKIKRWPARSLAPKRKPNVKGCIRSLMVSIIIIKGIRGVGVP